MFEVLSFIFGGIFRLAPEFLKWMDKKDERKHELAMLDAQMKADELYRSSNEQANRIFIIRG